MAKEINIEVTPSLHPSNVREVEGYSEETAAVLGATETAFSAAYEGIRAVHEARKKAKTNPTWNEAQQIINTQELADKVFGKVAKGFDSTRANLVKGIEHLEQELSQPVESKAVATVAGEIRRHIAGLQTGERLALIRNAIESGDHVTATAVLGAPSYLSGIDAKMQATLLVQYHSKHNPAKAQRLKAMKGACKLIEDRAGLVFAELEKAVGMAPHKVKALRDAKNAAEQAFILKDAA